MNKIQPRTRACVFFNEVSYSRIRLQNKQIPTFQYAWNSVGVKQNAKELYDCFKSVSTYANAVGVFKTIELYAFYFLFFMGISQVRGLGVILTIVVKYRPAIYVMFSHYAWCCLNT